MAVDQHALQEARARAFKERTKHLPRCIVCGSLLEGKAHRLCKHHYQHLPFGLRKASVEEIEDYYNSPRHLSPVKLKGKTYTQYVTQGGRFELKRLYKTKAHPAGWQLVRYLDGFTAYDGDEALFEVLIDYCPSVKQAQMWLGERSTTWSARNRNAAKALIRGA